MKARQYVGSHGNVYINWCFEERVHILFEELYVDDCDKIDDEVSRFLWSFKPCDGSCHVQLERDLPSYLDGYIRQTLESKSSGRMVTLTTVEPPYKFERLPNGALVPLSEH